jgi:hypothetical protein
LEASRDLRLAPMTLAGVASLGVAVGVLLFNSDTFVSRWAVNFAAAVLSARLTYIVVTPGTLPECNCCKAHILVGLLLCIFMFAPVLRVLCESLGI